jgi:hypothetical protein
VIGVDHCGRQIFQGDGSFQLFLKLPIELRHIIWAFCWPESRIIEAANTEFNKNVNEYTGTTYLRIAGPLSILLQTDFGGNRSLDSIGPLMQCHPPVTLQVCRESRNYTLTHYHIMQHKDSATCPFYFNPSRDILWLCRELTGEPECRQDLESCYGKQLNTITTILIEEAEWTYCTPAWYFENYFPALRCLKSIILVHGVIDQAGNLITEAAASDHRINAEKRRLELKGVCCRKMLPAKTILYVDRNGQFY